MFLVIGRWSASGDEAFDTETGGAGEGEVTVVVVDGCDGATSRVVEYRTGSAGSAGGSTGGEGEGGGAVTLGTGTVGIGFVSCVRNNDEMGSMGTRGGVD